MPDSTSFSSILAGVKRLRDQETNVSASTSSAINRGNAPVSISANSSIPPSSAPVGSSSTPTTQKTNLEKTPGFMSAKTVMSARISRNQPVLASAVSRERPDGARVAQMPRRANIDTPLTADSSLFHRGTASASSTNIKVNKAQQGNPLLKAFKGVSWEYASPLVPDYLVNSTISVFFLSLKYHRLHPEYIYSRIQKSGVASYGNPMQTLADGSANQASFDNGSCNILMVIVDIENHVEVLQELNSYCIMNNLSLMLGWNFEECAKYIVACKQGLDNRATNVKAIKGIDNDSPSLEFKTRFENVVTRVSRVNKTDASNLLREFGSFRALASESMLGQKLEGMNGFGEKKIENLVKMFEEPFVYNRLEERAEGKGDIR